MTYPAVKETRTRTQIFWSPAQYSSHHSYSLVAQSGPPVCLCGSHNSHTPPCMPITWYLWTAVTTKHLVTARHELLETASLWMEVGTAESERWVGALSC